MIGPEPSASARYRLEVEPLDLGADVRAVELELLETGTGEPARGNAAAAIWSRTLPALAGEETWALDFFSHLDRVRAYCDAHGIAYRQAAARLLAIAEPADDALAALFARFEAETFGARAGLRVLDGDAPLEAELSRHGGDAYHHAYSAYFFCALCDFETGSLTLLTDQLTVSEVLRRLRPTLRGLPVQVGLPN